VVRSSVTDVAQSRTDLVTRAVDWNHPDAESLRAAMASEVGPRYADRAALMAKTQANAVNEGDVHRTFVVYRCDAQNVEQAVGHAALRWNGPDLELKRMFVHPDHRGSGVSTALLQASENAARDQGLRRLILQTGDRQPDAVRLYEKSGYTRIPVFPPYELLPFSNTFEKRL
jgi:GNAT superfamily N-acetyltransferase